MQSASPADVGLVSLLCSLFVFLFVSLNCLFLLMFCLFLFVFLFGLFLSAWSFLDFLWLLRASAVRLGLELKFEQGVLGGFVQRVSSHGCFAKFFKVFSPKFLSFRAFLQVFFYSRFFCTQLDDAFLAIFRRSLPTLPPKWVIFPPRASPQLHRSGEGFGRVAKA